jgi:putative ABC transport system substrate-binding protein
VILLGILEDTTMPRRTLGLLLTLALGFLVTPLASQAPQPTTVPRVGYLSDEPSSLGVASFEPIAKALRDLGYLKGHTIVFEHRYADGKPEILPRLAVELVRLDVDVIVAVGTSATRAAKHAADTIPIVFTRIAAPVAFGFVASLARPSGNLTDVSTISSDLEAKRLELLTAALPGVRRVGCSGIPPSRPPHFNCENSSGRLVC